MSEAGRNADRGHEAGGQRQPAAPARGQRSQATGAEQRHKPAADLLADLAEARRAERVAVSLLAEVRDELATIVINAKVKGVGYDRMSQATLRAVRSPTVTLAEREREAVRLRKLVHRYRVTSRHGFPSAAHGTAAGSGSPSMNEGEITMAQKLISRKTIEEHFVETDEDEHLDEGDDLEGEEEREEDDLKPSRAARPRR